MIKDPAVEAIKFAVTLGLEASTFLELWLHGEWDELREAWPNVPDSVIVPLT